MAHLPLETLVEYARDDNLVENENGDVRLEWHRSCVAALAVAASTCNAWLLFAGAAVAMHSKQVGRISSDMDSISSYSKFRQPQMQSQSQNYSDSVGGQSNPTESDKESSAPLSGSQQSSRHRKYKRKLTDYESSVFDRASDKLLQGMEKMCSAIISSVKKLSKIDGERNVKIFEELSALNLRRPYFIRCYKYLCEDPSAATAFLSLPFEFRQEMLVEQVGSDIVSP